MRKKPKPPCESSYNYFLLLRRNPDDVPMAFWRDVRRYWLVLIVPQIVILADLSWMLLRGAVFYFFLAWKGMSEAAAIQKAMDIPGWWDTLAFTASFVTFMIAARYHKSAFRRRVLSLDREMCLHCGYCLTGLPAAHDCPECGKAYFINDVRKKWNIWFGYK